MRAAPVISLVLFISCGTEEPASRTNLLLISLDSTRADRLGCYGYRSPFAPEAESTPNLDRLAERGTVFEEALATSSWTLPSHAAILTGTGDLEHGVELDGRALGPGHRTLAERLAEVGYRTSGFFSGPYLEPSFGFGRGFERYRACYGPELAQAAERARNAPTPRNLRAVEVASHRDHSSPTVADAALDELAEAARDGRPFFLFLHLFDPHYDYVPPPPFDVAFDPGYEGTLTGEDFYRNPAVATFDPASPSGRARQVSDRDLEHLLALYTGDVAATDAAVGRVLAALERLGLRERTLVAVVGDHGDEFFEHGGIGHRRTLEREVLRVPLLVAGPGVPARHRVSHPVSTQDLAPTVLRLLGFEGEGAPDLLAAAAEPRGALSRLVRRFPVELEVEVAGVPRRVSALRVEVREAFRLGDVELQRRRGWHAPAPENPVAIRRAVEALGARERDAEELWWLDRAEEDPEPRTDTDDARVAAALGAWRERAEALGARRVAPTVTDAAELQPALDALGYGGEATSAGAEDAGLVLPPPGG